MITSGRILRKAEKILLSPFRATQSSGISDGVVTTFANEAASSAGLSMKTVLGGQLLDLSHL